MDMLTFDEFSKTLNAQSDETRAKPCNGWSEAADVFKAATVDLRTFQAKGLLGKGLNSLLSIMETNGSCLDVLNTYGAEVSRDAVHTRAACADFVDIFTKLSKSSIAKNLVVDMRQCAVRLAHMAQWMHSIMSMCEGPVAYAKSIPRPDAQLGSVELKALQAATQDAQTKLVEYMTAALLQKCKSTKQRSSQGGTVDDYSQADLLSQDLFGNEPAEEDLLAPSGGVTALVSSAAASSATSMQAEMKRQMEGMMQVMLQQMLQGTAKPVSEPSRPSSATLDLAAELEAAADYPLDEPEKKKRKKNIVEDVDAEDKTAKKKPKGDSVVQKKSKKQLEEDE